MKIAYCFVIHKICTYDDIPRYLFVLVSKMSFMNILKSHVFGGHVHRCQSKPRKSNSEGYKRKKLYWKFIGGSANVIC